MLQLNKIFIPRTQICSLLGFHEDQFSFKYLGALIANRRDSQKD